jgi:DNA-binding transcriptional LysR family regulator
MSITIAARELCVVQSAISRQIQALEACLGYRLFVRGHRSIEFTNEGQRLFRTADVWLEQMGEVVAALRPATARQSVTISASIGVTALWLLPRLGAFQLAAPEVDVRVAACNRLIDLERENVDLALRYCKPAEAPAGAIHLFDEALVPVANPQLGTTAIEDPVQLRRSVLLEFDDVSRPWLQWPGWLRGAGTGKHEPKGILRFNQYDQVVQAALAGQGIALGRLELVRPLLEQGKLVRATARADAGTDYGYWLLERRNPAGPNVALVRDWILAEAARVPA